MNDARILAIVPVRDYADIITDTLRAASRWSDRVFVLDNGSTDGSIELIEQAARELDNVDFLGVDRRPWSYAYYAAIYQRAKRHARPGDWWYRVDADELAVDDPRLVLDRVQAPYDTVRGSLYCYYFTTDDLAAYEADPTAWDARPLQDRIRWYRNDWAEPRFVRHRRLQHWADHGWRRGPMNMAPEMVPIRHYQFRSPAQMKQRVALRAAKEEWSHETPEAQEQWERPLFLKPDAGAEPWHYLIADKEQLDYDDGGPLRPRPWMLPPPAPLQPLPRRAVAHALALTPLYRRLQRLRGGVQ